MPSVAKALADCSVELAAIAGAAALAETLEEIDAVVKDLDVANSLVLAAARAIGTAVLAPDVPNAVGVLV